MATLAAFGPLGLLALFGGAATFSPFSLTSSGEWALPLFFIGVSQRGGCPPFLLSQWYYLVKRPPSDLPAWYYSVGRSPFLPSDLALFGEGAASSFALALFGEAAASSSSYLALFGGAAASSSSLALVG